MFQPVRNGDRSGRGSRLCGFVLILVGSGCSVAFELDREQCETTADCVAAGHASASCENRVCVLETDPAWSCLGSFVPPVPGAEVRHDIRFEYATKEGVPPEDLTVKLCAALDAGCANPIAGTPQPDEDGRVLLDVAPGFKGFLEATAPDLVPSLYFLQSPVVLPMKENVVRVVTPGEFNALAIASGFMVDESRGTAVILTDNCLDERAQGVIISTLDGDEETTPFYFNGALPDPEAAQTDAQGAGGLFNLPVATVSIETFRVETMEFIGKASLGMRAGHISYTAVGPTPP